MVVVKISDGLGNQMFQYAFGKSISNYHAQELKLETTYFNKNNTLRSLALKKFNISNGEMTKYENLLYNEIYRYVRYAIRKINFVKKIFLNLYTEKKEYSFDENVFETSSNYFTGYWQDYRYFENIRDILVSEFTLKEKLDNRNIEAMKNIKRTDSVSIHIRRGDYLSIKGQEVCSLEYYHKAIEYLSQHIENPTFFVFSDDIEWVKTNLSITFPLVYINFNQNNPELDLELIKNCKHNIIANSTFSWWGAWLNENNKKIVILPKEWRIGFPTPTGLVAKNWMLL